MKTHTLLALVCLSLLTPTLFGQTNAPADSTNAVTPPPIPEEARKHFVMGETMFKQAKSADDFAQAAREYKQAADLAPQLQQARYDLALAEEAGGDYSSAITDLKLYQQFKLSDDEARNVQDKIYAIEAKQQMQASDATAKATADAASAQAAAKAQSDSAKKAFINSIQGDWLFSHNYFLSINLVDGESVDIKFHFGPPSQIAGQDLPISDVSITGTTLRFTVTGSMFGDVETYKYNLSVDRNGQLNGTILTKTHYSGGGYSSENSQDCVFNHQ